MVPPLRGSARDHGEELRGGRLPRSPIIPAPALDRKSRAANELGEILRRERADVLVGLDPLHHASVLADHAVAALDAVHALRDRRDALFTLEHALAVFTAIVEA